MCIIIDTNKLSEFCANPKTQEAVPIHAWLRKGGVVVYSVDGKLGEELKGDKRRYFLELNQSGRAMLIKPSKISAEQEQLENSANYKSNDVHILALARASGARVLYTGDSDLMNDFGNKKIIDNPRGKIYSSARNKNLLKADLCKQH